MLASSFPDGLEKLAEKLGIEGRAKTLVSTPLADYELQPLDNPFVRKAAAGLAGLACIYVVCALAARLLRRNSVATPPGH
jgi:hypothetical protein